MRTPRYSLERVTAAARVTPCTAWTAAATSLRAKQRHWVDPQHAPGGDVAREHRDHAETGRYRNESQWIERCHTHQHAADDASREVDTRCADQNAQHDEGRSLSDDEPQERTIIGADDESQGELVTAAHDGSGHDAVQTHCREEQRAKCEG